MVILHVKKAAEELFLYESKLNCLVEEVKDSILEIYHGCLKVKRICTEMELLQDYGASRPVEMHGLLEDQIAELKLTDDYEDKHLPVGGYEENKDPCGKRNGRRPKEPMREALSKTMAEAKGIISVEQIKSGVALTLQHVQDALSILKGGVEVVYPEGLPPNDPIRLELENPLYVKEEEKKNWWANSATVQLWFATTKLENDKQLSAYFGRNEKTKVVVKIQAVGGHAPAREPMLTEEQRKELMLSEFKRREQLKKLEEDDDNSYLNSNWADNLGLKKNLHGLNNVSWKPH